MSKTSKTEQRKTLVMEDAVEIRNRRLTALACFLLLAVGLILRLYYVKLTPYHFSKHDLGYMVGLDSESLGSGHLGYIEYILKHRALPDFNPTSRWSFYNPPLFHICAAIVMRLWLCLGISYETAWELTQLLPCACIFVMTLAGYKIMKEFDIKGIPLVMMTGFLSFFPALSYLSLALNNDAMSLMLSSLAILFAIRWYREPTRKRLVGIALCIGLGMMTKLTVALVAPGVALLFLVKFLQNKKYGDDIREYSIFAAICVPLGLFWSVRNALLYDMPFTYVQALPEKSAQNVSGYSLGQRLGILPFSDWTRITSSWSKSQPIGHPDYNIWTQTLRTALFDDNALTWRTPVDETAAQVLMILGLLTAIALTVTFVIGMARSGKISKMLRGFLIISALFNFMHFLKFCFDYPMTCTIHFRYLVPMLLYGAVGFGLWWQSAPKKTYIRVIRAALCVLLVAFCALATHLYLNCLTVVAQ